MWEWLGKAALGVAGALGGPLRIIVEIIIQKAGAEIVSALKDWMQEREDMANVRTKKAAITQEYKFAMLSAKTPEEKEAAFEKYETALAALNSKP